ncbi:sulfatase [candidate division CSSED10-310 bacterium]|uniref:Sulfatase n=1 Tax=candidate division CSSED10-310 bacterium TaxID=2855610 RepID=A0ABV6YSM4_UNCC1
MKYQVLMAVCAGIFLGIAEFLGISINYPLARCGSDTIMFATFVIMGELAVMVSFFGLATLISRLVPGSPLKRTHLFACLFIIYSTGLFLNIPPKMKFPEDSESRLSKQSCRNIILVVMDTLRQDRLGCYGNYVIKTPGCDLFSKRGIIFPEVTTQIPITAPSHASMFTGLYPYEHGSRYNGVPVNGHVPLLAEILKKAGFFPAAFVSSTAVKGGITELKRGFEIYDEQFFLDRMNPQFKYVFPVAIMMKIFKIRGAERRAWLTNKRLFSCLPLLSQNAPFFLWLHYYDPHIPYQPSPPYDTMYDPDYQGTTIADLKTLLGLREKKISLSKRELEHIVSLYDGEVTSADRAFEQFYHYFQHQFPALFKNTLIVFTSDHGESLMEHEYFFYHGEKLYDQSLLVPLIISPPALNGHLIAPSQQILLLDLFATFLDFAGIITENTGPSRSLSQFFTKNQTTRKLHDQAVPAENGTLFFLNKGKHELHLETKIFSLRNEKWKYIIHPDGREEFYNLGVDPAEIENRLNEQKELEQYRAIFSAQASILRGKGNLKIKINPAAIDDLKSLGYINEGESD